MHGHRRNAFADFVFALILTRSCCQAALARTFDNEEAALKRLSRFVHNPDIDVEQTAHEVGRFVTSRVPRHELVRIAVDWTVEAGKHLLVATLIVGSRGIPIFWRAYKASALKGRTREYERTFLRVLVHTVLSAIARNRVLITADRGFADAALMKLLDSMCVGFVIRRKGCVTVLVDGQWRKLNTLRFRTNARHRRLGKVAYCQSEPTRRFLTLSRQRGKKGRWGVWYLVSNREMDPATAAREYARRWNCESGFRDAKSVLGFSKAKIRDVEAWARMFALVAIALLVLLGLGTALITRPEVAERLLRRVRSRRQARSELSLVRAIVDLLKRCHELWKWLNPARNFNLDAAL
jgi:hypothetical protein